MTDHYVRPDGIPEPPPPARPSRLRRALNAVANLMGDRKPYRYPDGRLPMIGFHGGVRQMLDPHLRPDDAPEGK